MRTSAKHFLAGMATIAALLVVMALAVDYRDTRYAAREALERATLNGRALVMILEQGRAANAPRAY